jgi:phenylpropionate dioxygenase-like ring-hydroxylating dioxygenase large terminal subunit
VAADWYLDNDDARLSAAWHPVARGADVAAGPPVPARLLGRPLHLHRTPDGEVAATGARAVQERYGLVWAALDPPRARVPEIPELEAGGWRCDVLARRTRVSAGVLVDNFLDVTHFSYLHQQSFGRARPVTDDGYALTSTGDCVQLRHDTVLHEMRRTPDGGLGQRRIATYTYRPPYWVHLQMLFPADGERAAATLVCQPESADSTVAYVVVALPEADPDLAGQLAFSLGVLEEDLVVLERLADPRLPLTLRTELHTRVDRASVEMRRTLAAFVTDRAGAGAA